MRQDKEIRWLYRQLPSWVEKRLIGQDHADAIRRYYGEMEEKPAYQLAAVLVSILGALLIGGGIILVFAYNWEDLSTAWRTVLSFAPLVLAQVLYGVAYFRKKDSPAWVEGTSAFLMLMLAACIALISQTYHIAGTTRSFLQSWLLLSIPLIYLMEATLVVVIYLAGIAWWAVEVQGGDSVGYWGFLAAALPHVVLRFRKEEAIRKSTLGWAVVITLSFGWFGAIEESISEFSLLGSSLLLSSFFLLGHQMERENRLIQQPFLIYSAVGIFIFAMLMTYGVEVSPFSWDKWWLGDRYPAWSGRINFGIVLLIITGYAFLLFRQINHRLPAAHLLAFLPVITLVFMQFSRMKAQWWAVSLANLYVLAVGIAYLADGIRQRNMSWVNAGMFFLLVLAGARFFDTDWSYVVKGVAFILLGCGFLGVNWVLGKRIRGVEKLKN